MLKWLKVNGVDRDDVEFVSIPFNQMLGPLTQGKFDAAFLPEPFRTLALEQGAKRIADPFQAVCSKICLLTLWMAPATVDRNLEPASGTRSRRRPYGRIRIRTTRSAARSSQSTRRSTRRW